MNYTKGEWEVNTGTGGAVVFEPDIGTIAQIPIDLEAWKANAQLIASAPDLYEALLMVALMTSPDNPSSTPSIDRGQIYRALAKAEDK